MGRVTSIGYELGSLTLEGTTTSGSPEVLSGASARSGSYYARLNNTSTSESIRYQFAATDQTARYYFRAYFYIAVSSTGTKQLIAVFNAALSGQRGGISLTSGNQLQLFNNSTQMGSNSGAVATGTWHRLELMIDTTTISATTYEARINGVTFATGTANLPAGMAQFLTRLDASDATYDVYFDDLAINDTSGSSQNSWCGSEKLLYLRPDAAGDSNGFLVQVGGTVGAANNFTRVNEVTPDDATTYNGSALLNAEDLFNCGASGLSSTDVINVVAVGVRMADLVAADTTAAFKLEIEKTAAGTKTQSGALAPNSTTWRSNAAVTPFNYSLTTYLDPDGGIWTSTTLDSMQIGYIQTVTNLRTIAVSNVWAVVGYTPSTFKPKVQVF